jgi:iron complex outermembrane receptor protein
LNGVLTGSFAGLEMRIQHKYSGSQWMDDGNRQLYDGHHITNLKLSYELQIASSPMHLSVQGGIRNLFDVQYASMILINAPSFGGNAPRYYYPGLPRQFHLGLKLAYE